MLLRPTTLTLCFRVVDRVGVCDPGDGVPVCDANALFEGECDEPLLGVLLRVADLVGLALAPLPAFGVALGDALGTGLGVPFKYASSLFHSVLYAE